MAKITRIWNGNIVTPEQIIERGTIIIEDGEIAGIQTAVTTRQENDIDATGKWILPGLVDTHSDAIEQEIQPRPTSIMPFHSAFYELERKLVGQGITTMFHSLSLYYTEGEGNWIRQNQNVEKIITDIKKRAREKTLIDHKIHLRYEMRNKEGLHLVEKLIRRKEIDQLSFMDHTPGKGAWADVDVQRKKIMKQFNFNQEEADAHMKELQENASINMEEIKRLGQLAHEYNITLASHDDDSKEKVELLHQWKAKISEFPISLEVARQAREQGVYVVMGAPNLLLGKSHNNNLSTMIAIKEGVVDILCSDYYPGSLLQGVFYLVENGVDLVKSVNMASLNPAIALGLSETVGSIEIGKRADLLIVSTKEHSPVLEKVLVNGQFVYQVQYI